MESRFDRILHAGAGDPELTEYWKSISLIGILHDSEVCLGAPGAQRRPLGRFKKTRAGSGKCLRTAKRNQRTILKNQSGRSRLRARILVPFLDSVLYRAGKPIQSSACHLQNVTRERSRMLINLLVSDYSLLVPGSDGCRLGRPWESFNPLSFSFFT